MKLGQHFLTDVTTLKLIASFFNNCKVIEIGPGKGALTEYLLEKNEVIAYEIDRNLIAPLKAKFPNLELYNEDVRKIQLNCEYLVGNLPYYITKPILKEIINSKILKLCILLIQKEVALKLFSVKLNKLKLKITNYYNVELIKIVNKTLFKPVPMVDGAIIKLDRKLNSPYNPNLINILWNMFKYPRKKINTILKIENFNLKITSEIGHKRLEDLTNEDLLILNELNVST